MMKTCILTIQILLLTFSILWGTEWGEGDRVPCEFLGPLCVSPMIQNFRHAALPFLDSSLSLLFVALKLNSKPTLNMERTPNLLSFIFCLFEAEPCCVSQAAMLWCWGYRHALPCLASTHLLLMGFKVSCRCQDDS